MGATNFAMLGLGDIVIPGIFIALLLRLEEILNREFFSHFDSCRYDNSLKRNSNFYFNATFIGRFLVVRIISSYDSISAYLAGLLLTIFVMHVYKHAQPALLYLVPACLGRTPTEL